MKKNLMIITICVLLLVGCQPKRNVRLGETLYQDKDLVSQLGKDHNISDFFLLGKYYRLPCRLGDFIEQGWELVDEIGYNPYSLEDVKIEKGKSLSVYLFNDYRQIQVIIKNDTKRSISIQEDTIVASMNIDSSPLFEEADFVTKQGVTLITLPKDIKGAFEDRDLKCRELSMSVYDHKQEKMSFQFNEEKLERIELNAYDSIYPDQGFENKTIDEEKDKMFSLKLIAHTAEKQYSSYEVLMQAIEDDDAPYNYFFKGRIVQRAQSLSSIALREQDQDPVYIIEDENLNWFVIEASDIEEALGKELEVGKSIEVYTYSPRTIEDDNEQSYPLFEPVLVLENGKEIYKH